MHHMREGLTKAHNKKKKAIQTVREHPGGLFMPSMFIIYSYFIQTSETCFRTFLFLFCILIV